MARIRQADQGARARLRRRSSTGDARAPFRDAIAALQGEEMLEVHPEGGETIRGLKVNVSRAGKEAGIDVQHGETVDGTLLVWRRSGAGRRRRNRRQEPDRSKIIP